MTILRTLYASAPASEVLIPTIEIRHASMPTVYLTVGFKDVTATLEDASTVTFIATGMDISLPEKDASGNQSLIFAIDNITGEAQRFVDTALEAGGEMLLIYREYLASDLTTPASTPKTLNIIGGTFEGGTFQAEASYYDMLNTAWPRDRYTADFAPGIKYIS
jgi:hypothetical protein